MLKTFTNNRMLITLCIVVFLIFMGIISPMTQIKIDDICVDGPGSIAVNKTDDQSLVNYYHENITIDKETTDVIIQDYPMRALRSIALSISMEKGDFSFRNINIQVLGQTVSSFPPGELHKKLVCNDSSTLIYDSNRTIVKTNSGNTTIELNAGSMLYAKVFIIYFLILLLFLIIFTLAICFILNKVNAYSLIDRCNPFLITLMNIMAVVLFGEVLVKGWGFWGFGSFLLNILIVVPIYLAILAIFGRRIGHTIGILFFSSLPLIDYYIIKFKGTPLVPWDLSAIKTAVAVSDKYSFFPDRNVFLFLSAIILLIIVSFFLVGKQKHQLFSFRKRLILLTSSFFIGIMILYTPVLDSIPANAWGTDILYNYKEYGTTCEFVNYYKKNRIHKPNGYSKQHVKELIEKYEKDSNQSYQIIDQPDQIIMIMNESFSDLDQFSKTININEMSFFDELAEESITGDLYVSVRGGGTCNTELEALTGYSMAFLPAASYPYVNYLKEKEFFSLAKYFGSKGFDIAGLHLEKGTNWSRDTVYRNMGIEPFYTIDNYDDVTTLRGYATDEYNYKKLIEIENKMTGHKKFIFNVTIQNHGGYDDLEGLNILDDLSYLKQYRSAQVYFSLIKISDDALKELVNYYREDKHKTMLIFFGDHQPELESEVDTILFGDETTVVDEATLLNKYKTPLLIWKNYSTKKKNLGKVSANYLPMLIMKEAGYPLTPFMKIVSKAYESFPVLTTQGIIDSEGRYYKSLSAISHSKDILNDYQIAQYEGLFGNDGFNEE